MPLNRKLFLRIKKHILEEPKRFNMDIYIYKTTNTLSQDNPPCGTVACIAGWSNILGDNIDVKTLSFPYFIDQEVETKRLGLKLDEDFSSSVFFVKQWPTQWKTKYDGAISIQEKAEVAADFIDYILEHEKEFAA
jgi:hypothetical protein